MTKCIHTFKHDPEFDERFCTKCGMAQSDYIDSCPTFSIKRPFETRQLAGWHLEDSMGHFLEMEADKHIPEANKIIKELKKRWDDNE